MKNGFLDLNLQISHKKCYKLDNLKIKKQKRLFFCWLKFKIVQLQLIRENPIQVINITITEQQIQVLIIRYAINKYYRGLNTRTLHVFEQQSELGIKFNIYACTHVTTAENRYIASQAIP